MTDDDLNALIDQGLSYRDIGKILGKGETTIRYHCKKLGLKTKVGLQYKFPDDLLISTSERVGSLTKLVIELRGSFSAGAYYHLKQRVEKLGIVFPLIEQNCGGGHNRKRPNEVLVLGTQRVKREVLHRALQEIGVPYQCVGCGITRWKEHEITLEIHHKNENSCDNRKENLEYLCPNCHSQE